MTIFFTDLDHTLIYSHRQRIPEPKRCVETLSGREQSFMTEKTWSYLRDQEWLDVIPVTTRTKAQYERLSGMQRTLGFGSALIYNGAVLLEKGREDISWRNESVRLAEADLPAFSAVSRLVREAFSPEDIVFEENIMLYVKTDDASAVYRHLADRADLSHVFIGRDARKVYCMPGTLSKGNALKRYLKRAGEAGSIAAGDSAFDISMLEEAQFGLCPASLKKDIRRSRNLTVCPDFFSDSICDRLEEIRKGQLPYMAE